MAIARSLPPELRTISRFAEEEIVLPPTGPYANQQFSLDRQPFARLWFELIESQQFVRFAATGPLQSGKTLLCFVIILMYHLFEVGENVACGITEMGMAMDKWTKDILPVIMASRYAALMPTSGQGSEGGKFESITFKNGATLKFMSAKGGDEKRSGFTARVLIMTEVDKYDEAGESSREADPVTQMIGRLEAFEVLNTVIYMECSVSIETGRIWTEVTNGSNSRIVLRCQYCGDHVTPEREHLQGWQDALNELQALREAHYCCPTCGHPWTEEDRIEANKGARLLHKGQTIDKAGNVTGEIPQTLTAGFRWTAVNNLFKSAGDFGWKEFTAKHNPDEENSERGLCQFTFVVPVKDTAVDVLPLNVAALMDRTHKYPRGIVPDECQVMSVGLDLGGWTCHWTAIAWGANAHGFIVDYGQIHVPQGTLGLEAGLIEALKEFRDRCSRGWMWARGGQIIPDENLIDSGWKTQQVYSFIQETGLPFRPCKGFPVAGEPVSYNRPKSTGAVVQWIGDGWHIAKLKDDQIYLVEVDADETKSILHARLNSEITAPGAITMFDFDRSKPDENQDRRDFIRHLTAEKSSSEFIPGRGTVTRWVKIRAQNHYLDSTALALVGGKINGVEVISAETPTQAVVTPAPAPAVQRVEERDSRAIVRSVGSGWVRRK